LIDINLNNNLNNNNNIEKDNLFNPNSTNNVWKTTLNKEKENDINNFDSKIGSDNNNKQSPNTNINMFIINKANINTNYSDSNSQAAFSENSTNSGNSKDSKYKYII
jgi:hypothetical protein